MGNGYPKVLYFIGGTAPTKEQMEDAENAGPGVAFRNALLIHPDGPIEECDAVAGDFIPENYAEALPNISDGEEVKKRMAKRNPGLARGLGVEPEDTEPTETDEQKSARIANALARGQRQSPVNERNAEPVGPMSRTTQAGTPRVTYPEDDWQTNPETVNEAYVTGQGLGATRGDEGQPGRVPVGSQGEGGPGHRDRPRKPQAGRGNPRAQGGPEREGQDESDKE